MSTTALRAFIRELAAPSIPPKPAPIRRGPLEWFTYAIADMGGWSCEIGYRWSQESREDRIEIEIVVVELWTAAGRTILESWCFDDATRERIEDLIREEVEKRLEAERDDRDTRWERSR